MSLQAGRAIAALAVVLNHARYSTEYFVHPLPPAISEAFRLCYLGVDFFFVLSGFIITHAHYDNAPGLEPASKYIGKRLRRVFVPYLPISLGLVAVFTLTPWTHYFVGVSGATHEWGLLPSVLLIPDGLPPALVPAWTLIQEVLFYSIFLIFFVSKRALVVTLCLWAASLGIFAAYDTGVLSSVNVVFKRANAFMELNAPFLLHEFKCIALTALAPINLEFILGAGCFALSRRLDKKLGPLLLVAGICLSVLALFLISAHESPRELFGVAMAVTVLGLALSEDLIRVPQSLVFLGTASYSIYLAHYPVITALSKLYPIGWQMSLLLLSLAGVAAGIAYHLLIERQLLRSPAINSQRLLAFP